MRFFIALLGLMTHAGATPLFLTQALVESPFCAQSDPHQAATGPVNSAAACDGSRLISATSFSGAASAGADNIGVYRALASFQLADGLPGDTVLTEGSAATTDTLIVNTGSKMVLRFLITGFVSAKSTSPFLAANALFRISCDGAFDTQDVTAGGFYIFSCPYTANRLFTLGMSLEARASLGAGGGLPVNVAVTADYANTARLVSFEITDDSGRIVPGAIVTSESGFDYLGVTNVPEPGTWSATLLGCLAVMVFRRYLTVKSGVLLRRS